MGWGFGIWIWDLVLGFETEIQDGDLGLEFRIGIGEEKGKDLRVAHKEVSEARRQPPAGLALDTQRAS